LHRSDPHLRAHLSRAGTSRIRRSLQRPPPASLSRPAGAEDPGVRARPNRQARSDPATSKCGPRWPHSRVPTCCVTSLDEYSARTGAENLIRYSTWAFLKSCPNDESGPMAPECPAVGGKSTRL
jgi:hypothetical protein